MEKGYFSKTKIYLPPLTTWREILGHNTGKSNPRTVSSLPEFRDGGGSTGDCGISSSQAGKNCSKRELWKGAGASPLNPQLNTLQDMSAKKLLKTCGSHI